MNQFIFGIHAVCETLKLRPKDVAHIIIIKERLSSLVEIVPISSYKKEEWMKWVQRQVSHFKEEMSHQGIVAQVKSQKAISLEEVLDHLKEKNELGLILVLDEITDPQNLGALIRTAACAKAHAVVIPERGAAQVTSVVTKVAQGGVEHVVVCGVSNINYALEKLKNRGFWVMGLDAKAEVSLFDMDAHQSLALVIGNEESGLRRLVREKCDLLVKIPMPGAMDSLNASTAGGIALFEVVRKRLKKS